MNAQTSTPFKFTALVLSAAMTLSLAGAVVRGFTHPPEIAMVQLPTVVIIGYRDGVTVPDTLQANAKPTVKPVAKAGA